MDLFKFDDPYVRRLKEHDPATEEHFVEYFTKLLFVTLRKRLPDVDAINDVTQETLLRALKRIGELRDSRKLGAFVLGISHHVLQEWYRNESRTLPLNEDHKIIPSRTNIEAEFLSSEITARVREVLARMPERDAAILQAIFLDYEDKDEVCRRFGVDRQYLRVLVHRAKKWFRSLF
jgi:RNA polymerase sigma-70 factor (ECF subfamily)